MVYTPFLLVFHITGRCNLRCAYCYASPYERIDLTFEEAENVLSQAAGLGTKHVILSGGEALLHPDFYRIAERVNELGMRVHLTSNGTLIDDTVAEKLKSLDAFVTISLDGSRPEVNDPLRGIGTFSSAISAIDTLIKCGVPTSMRMTLVRQNVDDVRNYLDLAIEHNVDRCIIERVTAIREVQQSYALEPTSLEVCGVFETMAEYADRLNVGSNDPLWVLFRRDILEKYRNKKHICGGCTAGVASITVLPDLVVTPCPRLPIAVGNLREDSLEDVWLGSEVLQNLRKRELFDGCSSCEYKYLCGGCRGAAYAHGSYLGKDPQCWRVNK
ncbi:MAG: radical SAM protein [Candidatus Freyrarchaeum guaymaensis]